MAEEIKKRSEIEADNAVEAANKIIHLSDFEKSYDEARQDLIKFTEKQIDLMNSNILFGGAAIPQFTDLNKSLMNYESITLGLTSLHAQIRFEKDVAQENYDNFFAEKYFEVKSSSYNLGLKKEMTQKEIELYVRKTYLSELSKLKAECIKTENEYNTVDHLIAGWDKFAFVLNTLSKNAQAEANAAGIASKHPYEFGDES